MQVFRVDSPTILQSPVFEMYGRQDGVIIAPLDLVLIQLDGSPSFRPPTSPGTLNGFAIRTPVGGNVGTIQSYDFPPADPFNIKPFVKIEPADGVTLGAIPDTKVDSAPPISVGSPVTFQGTVGSVPGTVVSSNILTLPYPSFSSRVQHYQINFSRHILPSLHGGRVFIDSSSTLLGMLIATQNLLDGTCDAMVFPSHLIG
ncbi:hypothetical protein [Acaryochloris sp. CCMEE 5410]|uniref:hypothetical protein n=1 Tax=Acaryochloris sp. CCMEE 5410 TaxID=310037 RepID=UPI000493F112|nr:hypothetical protein [Acaryochloris sp. CCMEE 5410]KAI9134865.1 hypothetical protein ON05_017475 [Acaryochloris sp. CCMEE 5410]